MWFKVYSYALEAIWKPWFYFFEWMLYTTYINTNTQVTKTYVTQEGELEHT